MGVLPFSTYAGVYFQGAYETKSVPNTKNADGTYEVVPAQANKRYIIKGITMTGDGNQGTVKLYRGNGTMILPIYFANGNRSSTSSNLNIVLDYNERIYFVISGRSANETFVGVSYIEVPDYQG